MNENTYHGFIRNGDHVYLLAGVHQIDYLCKGENRDLFLQAVRDVCAEVKKLDSWHEWASCISVVYTQLRNEKKNKPSLFDSVQAWWTICFGELTKIEDHPTANGFPNLNEDDARLALALPCTIDHGWPSLTKTLIKGLYHNRSAWYTYHFSLWHKSVRDIWNQIQEVSARYGNLDQEIDKRRAVIEEAPRALPGCYRTNNRAWQKYMRDHLDFHMDNLRKAICYVQTSGAAEEEDIDAEDFSVYLSWKAHLTISERAWSVFWDLVERGYPADGIIMKRIIKCLETTRIEQHRITGGCDDQGQCKGQGLRETLWASKRAWNRLREGAPEWIEPEFWWKWQEREQDGQNWLQALRDESLDK